MFEVIDNMEMPRELNGSGREKIYPDLEVGQGFKFTKSDRAPEKVRNAIRASYWRRSQKVATQTDEDGNIYVKRIA